MKCPVCGSETGLRVSGSPRRGEYSDRRARVCTECSTKVWVVESISSVELCGRVMKLDDAKKSKLYEDIQDKYLHNVRNRMGRGDVQELF